MTRILLMNYTTVILSLYRYHTEARLYQYFFRKFINKQYCWQKRNFKSATTFTYMNPKSYRSEVKEETTLDIKSEIDTGSLSLKIKSQDSNEVIYEADDLENPEATVTLQPGSYSLVSKGKISKGYIHITSE